MVRERLGTPDQGFELAGAPVITERHAFGQLLGSQGFNSYILY